MATPLKNQYGIEVVHTIAKMIDQVYDKFDKKKFIQHAQEGYDDLELMDRGRKIAEALTVCLPNDFGQSVSILLASLDTPFRLDEGNNIASFLFMPHVIYVAENGLDNFDLSMRAHYQLTQYFTSEFGIRPFIQKYPEQSLAVLTTWTKDPNVHVRRLVSEGTRTRLPWASRLPEFIKDPSPVVKLLELLKDDPELYVRRSVANNLNDIGKDHPELLAKIAKRWLKDASDEREWLVKHALRSAVKRGEKGALDALGYGKRAYVAVQNVRIEPQKAVMGESVQIGFDLLNKAPEKASWMVDFNVHFVKSNGQAKPKVFKLKAVDLNGNQSCSFKKKVSLKPMTTRVLYPGEHKVEVIVNGECFEIGTFNLSSV